MLRATQPTHRTHGRTTTRSRTRRQNRRTRSHGKPTLLRLRRQSHNIGTRQPIPHRQPPSRRLPRGRPRTLRADSRRHHRHARLNRTRHRANRTHRSARHETTHHGQGVSRTLRHHQRGGSENQFMGAEKRHQAASRMDIRRHEPMHPNARMGRRTKQNQRIGPGLRAGTIHRTDQQQRTNQLP